MNSSSTFIKKFSIYKNEIQLERLISPQTYCENVGRKAAILGYEKGVFEIWVYPFKILSGLQFSISIPEYNQFVNGTDLAKRITVRPELTTITFSHDLFTIQQHLLTPLEEPGSIVIFDVDSYLSIELWISFIPILIPMWPAGLGGQYTLWLEELRAYFIGEGSKKYVGLIGSPFAQRLSNTPGHQLPEGSMKFVIHVSKEVASESFIPVIIIGGMEGKSAAVRKYEHLLSSIPESYQKNYEHYQRLGKQSMTIKTPVTDLDLAYEWAKVSLDKGLVDNPQLGMGLVAGYGVSGKTYRPGFAWFFGGDTCLNSLAINCYCDFETTRKALTILRRNQRQDGKIFHELTQSAALLNWFEDYPSGFYHAETSAFYIVAMLNYFICSGDENFIRESWNSIKMAYQYCLTADKDNDGLMENSTAGLAAMEVGEMLEQNQVDIYLAAIWLQALKCMIELSNYFGEKEMGETCQQQFNKGALSLKKIFVDEEKKQLNFALLTNGETLSDTTVWQSIPLFFELLESEIVINTLHQFASSDMSTNWGIRGISKKSKYYNPISYNNGSVWPFLTGYIATAQYKHHLAINGWQNLLANSALTWLDALGWHTELLSGEYYRAVLTAVPHQLFSASGIIIPFVRGLLGLEGDIIAKQVKFTPHLPMDWEKLAINNYRCGQDIFDFSLITSNEKLRLKINHRGEGTDLFIFSPAFCLGTEIKYVSVNQKQHNYNLKNTRYDVHCEIECDLDTDLLIEIQYRQGIEFHVPLHDISTGNRSCGLKLIDYELSNNVLTMIVQGTSGCEYVIPLKTGFEIEKVNNGGIKKINDYFMELIVNFESNASTDFVEKNIQVYLNKPETKRNSD